ncbi:hypothetical protein EVAR_49517_1 [Eumeta japonica]|uniref:Uncharacterized protein n=1 Tax=Eumeta variegata TaxID=151549 RepID=A0A4C1VXQ3_EUMVA|nr:hypothetical protein EVAR_49517_1 [Eumeta japonica]
MKRIIVNADVVTRRKVGMSIAVVRVSDNVADAKVSGGPDGESPNYSFAEREIKARTTRSRFCNNKKIRNENPWSKLGAGAPRISARLIHFRSCRCGRPNAFDSSTSSDTPQRPYTSFCQYYSNAGQRCSSGYRPIESSKSDDHPKNILKNPQKVIRE